MTMKKCASFKTCANTVSPLLVFFTNSIHIMLCFAGEEHPAKVQTAEV